MQTRNRAFIRGLFSIAFFPLVWVIFFLALEIELKDFFDLSSESFTNIKVISFIVCVWISLHGGYLLYRLFNKLVPEVNDIIESESNISVLMQQRHDLIDRLLLIAMSYGTHETDTFKAITKLRSIFDNNSLQNDPQNSLQNENQGFSRSLPLFLATAESHPEIRADRHYKECQEQLSKIEDKLASEREKFNREVKEYNIYIQKFPDAIYAFLLGYRTANYYEWEGPKP